ncbi:hypothetical protein ACOSP7_007688 [Xanthoceras sorbifolium]|uniref:FLZ-type domain-containing protein n=1 Tax=Xanthoceras sorbifolium TaxID=99658 RepID=A0ABQ8IB87_9ROSI|nr:hypothetical protein JRO89_XS03G0211500 [Xanthoceras sorbifolium]
MSRMRSRAIRSSSQGELTVFNQLRPLDSPASFFEKKRPALATGGVKPREEEPRPRVTWTLGSPERGDSSLSKTKKIDEGYCAFLKNCSLCKKKLDLEEDLYMYGYLSAFCSPECRDDQIALDGFDKEVAKEAISIATSKQGIWHS